MKKAIFTTEENQKQVIQCLLDYLTKAQVHPEMSEKEKAWIEDDYNMVRVAYFKDTPDGDNQWSIKESNLTLSFAMAFSILTTRIENSCFVFEIEKDTEKSEIDEAEIEREAEFGTHKIEFEYKGERISLEIKPTSEDWWDYIDVKTEKSEYNFKVNFDIDYNHIAVYLEIDGDTIHSQPIIIDLFENSHLLPVEVKSVIDRYGELDEPTYDNCEAMLKELEPLGYTFDYELDAIPYDLRPIEKSEN